MLLCLFVGLKPGLLRILQRNSARGVVTENCRERICSFNRSHGPPSSIYGNLEFYFIIRVTANL
jgi:hypothetical protein